MKWIRSIGVTGVALFSTAALAMPPATDATAAPPGPAAARTFPGAASGGGSGEVMGIVINSGKTPPIVIEIGKTSDEDREFLFRAVARGLADIRLGQLALKKGASPAVRNEGRRLLADAKVNNQLSALALRKGLPLPERIPRDEAATYNRLSRLSGYEFDQQFFVELGSRIDESIRSLDEEATAGLDPDLRTWAAERLPALRLQRELAQADRVIF